ncbi:hypothetical protein Y032_0076g1039 [Ancylostoma ceylanicum]|nr:hypothetical protein Y032_0076g1039 [Ancylostoma ceylanicum]
MMDEYDHHYETVGPGASQLHRKPPSPPPLPPPPPPPPPFDPYYGPPIPPAPFVGAPVDVPQQLGSQETLGSNEGVSGSKGQGQSRGKKWGATSEGVSRPQDMWKKPCKIVFFITLPIWILFAIFTFIIYGHYAGLFNMVQRLKNSFLGDFIPKELETLYVPT